MINAILTYADSSSFSFATINGCKYNILKLQILTVYSVHYYFNNRNFKLIL